MSHSRDPHCRDFTPTACWANLRLRAQLLQKLREFFNHRYFLEVDTPLLSADVVVDRHLDPLPVTLFHDPRTPQSGRTMWLQTSPEPAMKRLLASGAEAIYQVTHAFRGGEQGDLHNPEFTIVEWYRREDSMQRGMQLLSDLADALLSRGPAETISYRAAFQEHLSLDPLQATGDQLVAAARDAGIEPPAGLCHQDGGRQDRDGWLDLLLVHCVEPHLGCRRPAIVYDYPASQAALAQIRDADVPVAERFELYVDGIELANGYHELRDADMLRTRSQQANARRAEDGKYVLPEESRLLQAMEHGLPPCIGVALGFDRLVMIAAGAQRLSDVIPFPIDRA